MEFDQNHYNYGNLPLHILVEVISLLKFSDMKNAVLTCKSWYWASCDRRITKKILINGLDNSSCIDYLQRPIQNIRLSAVNMNKFNFRKLLWTHGHTIKNLDLLFPKLAVTRIFEIFIYLPNIETVQIHFVSHYYSAKNFASFKRIATHRDKIAENLSQIKFLTIHTRLGCLDPMELFLSQCTNVEKLIWNEWIYLPYDQTAFICNFLLEPSRNPMLTNLNDLLIGCIDPVNSDDILKKLVTTSLPNLKRLHLKEISKYNYTSVFRRFCQVYHFLDGFTINGCNDQQLIDICQYMPNLKSLGMDNCIAIEFGPIANLSRLESLHINRVVTLRDDKLLELLNLKLKKLTKLSLNMISELALKCICENYPHLEQLILEGLDTKDCEPIFRNLTKLKVLNLSFMEPATCHSSRLQSSVDCNITRLTELKELYVSCWAPGITPMLVEQLPSVRIPFGQDSIYDPSEENFIAWKLATRELNEGFTNEAEDMLVEAYDSETRAYHITDFSLDLYNDSINII